MNAEYIGSNVERFCRIRNCVAGMAIACTDWSGGAAVDDVFCLPYMYYSVGVG